MAEEKSDWIDTFAAMKGQTREEFLASEAAEKKRIEELNDRLKEPARLHCHVMLTIQRSVEVDCDGCGTKEGKLALFNKALDAFADATGVEADIEYDNIAVYVGGPKGLSIFQLELNRHTRDIIRERKPDATAVECIMTTYKH